MTIPGLFLGDSWIIPGLFLDYSSIILGLFGGTAEEKVLMSNIIDQVACAEHPILYISIGCNGFQLLTQICVAASGSESSQRIAVFETV